MKKILLTTLLASTCIVGTSALAEDSGSQLFIGYDHLNVDAYNGNGVAFGWNYVIPLKVLGNGDTHGMELGFGANLGTGLIDFDGVSKGYYKGDAQLFAGYQYEKVHLRATLGYGFLQYDHNSEKMYGTVYGASAGYNITEKWGVEAAYKTGKMTPVVGSELDVSYVGVNLSWKH